MCHNRSLKPLSFVALLCCSSRGSLEFSRSTSWRRKSRFCQLHWSHRSSGGSNLYGKLEKKAKVLLVSLGLLSFIYTYCARTLHFYVSVH
ncbi:hypothetical protein MtrunA17_Chr4g0003521 [Medicago truncatula]|uniref:Transmembrane protein n=1 Tax=Medicago truncatula TaxID=3880 RepID=A0A396I127_MEDTR|nr:hypothetical protein MtrunA17_Chr4g0003521 [Medicago truncatula]